MFTGIVESIGEIKEKKAEGKNIHFKIQSPVSQDLSIDQSVSHNGVCLTVTSVEADAHWVTAVDETLTKSNLGGLDVGAIVNLERCMLMNGRLDGHIVQGHVDTRAAVKEIREVDGSWLFTFKVLDSDEVMVEKGSVCVNGVSLTCFNIKPDAFDVAIVPYTYQHTNFHLLSKMDLVNIEFDIIGKYLKALFLKSTKT